MLWRLGGQWAVEACSAAHDAGVSQFIREVAESDRPELTSASVVISGGRGMQNGDNFSLLEGIADKLNLLSAPHERRSTLDCAE